jgi:hypothetical protein
MMNTTSTRRLFSLPRLHDGLDDPAVAALIQLLESEREAALAEAPELVQRCDPGRVWLLWFAIGATDAICRLTQRTADSRGNHLFRRAVKVILGHGVRCDVDPILADRRLVELFETAGAEAVQACRRGDPRLGYYLDALRLSYGYHC